MSDLLEKLNDRALAIGLEEKLMSDDEFINAESTLLPGNDQLKSFSRNKLLNSNTGWVYACVDAISKEVASIDLKLFKVLGSGDLEEVQQSDLLDLISRANESMTMFDLLYLSQTNLELVGEAPWFLQFNNGLPENILMLRPDKLEVLPPKESDLKLGHMVGGYKYKVDDPLTGQSKEVKFDPIEVVFLKYPDAIKPFRGRGTLENVMQTFKIDETSEKYNLQFFRNAAVPSSVLSTQKKLKDEARRKLERVFREKYEGYQNAHKSILLEGEVDFKMMSLTQKEMDFIETNKFNRDKILGIFRVPKAVLGISEDVNRANAEAADFTFAKRTIKPKMQMLVEMLNEFLVPFFYPNGDHVLHYSDPVPENEDMKLKIAAGGVSGGWLTPNEAREMFGLEAIEGADELKQPGAFNPFGGFGDNTDEKPEDKPEDDKK